MTTDHAHDQDGIKLAAAAAAAAAAIVVGSMVLVGWAFDIAVLKSILPGWVSMKPNAVFCFILTGVALLLTAIPPVTLNPQHAVFLSRLARFCGLLAGLIGLLTLGEYIFGWNLGIDHWLVSEATGTVGTSHPGRMAPETALNFVLLSVALWVINVSRHPRRITQARRTILASVSLGLLVATSAVAALLTYLTPGLGAYGWFGLTIMAVHTAILFMMLGMAVIAISWQPEVLSWSLGKRITAVFACGMALLVFIGLNTSRSQFWMIETNRQIAQTERMLVDAGNLKVEIIDAQVHSRDYLITGDEQFLKLYLLAKADSQAKLDELYRAEFASGEAKHQQHSTRIEAQVKAQFQWLQQIIDAKRTGINEAALSDIFSHGDELLNNFLGTLEQAKSEDQQIVEQLKRESISVARFSYLSTFIGTLASLLIFMVVIFRLNAVMNERKQTEDTLMESEQHFRAVTESASDAFISADSTGKVVDWNPSAERLFGYTSAEIIGQPLTVLMPERFRDPHRIGLARVMAGGAPHVIGKIVELAGLHKDGSEFQLELSLAQWQTADGQFFTAMIRDITERKRAEDSLRKLSLAVEQSPNSIVITDLDANIEYVNKTFVKVTGYSLTEVIGQNPRLLHSGKTPRATYDDLWAHLTRGEVWKGEFINRRKDGSEYLESVLISPVHQADGRVTNYLAIKEDITEHKRIESDLGVNQIELERQNEELRQAQIALEESRDQFVDLYDFAPVGYLTLDREEMIDKINLTATALLGVERNKLLHHRFAPFVATEDRDRWHRHFLDVLKHDGQQRCELALRCSDGSVLHAQLDCLYVKADGTSSVRVALTDITERKLAEAKLAEQLEELQRWQVATSGREGRNLELKHEVNELLGKSGLPPRYPSAES